MLQTIDKKKKIKKLNRQLLLTKRAGQLYRLKIEHLKAMLEINKELDLLTKP